jgi:ferritin-like metal-binding protein YciE
VALNCCCPPRGKNCAAIVGITDEGAEIMKEYKGSPALDAGLLAAAQAVEHYEISRYGTLRADVVITSGTLYFKPRERPAARALNNAP